MPCLNIRHGRGSDGAQEHLACVGVSLARRGRASAAGDGWCAAGGPGSAPRQACGSPSAAVESARTRRSGGGSSAWTPPGRCLWTRRGGRGRPRLRTAAGQRFVTVGERCRGHRRRMRPRATAIVMSIRSAMVVVSTVGSSMHEVSAASLCISAAETPMWCAAHTCSERPPPLDGRVARGLCQGLCGHFPLELD